VDILKNYMANKSFSRGIETLGAEASMAFVGNTQHTLPYMLRHSDLFCELPEQYHDSAFLDRLHFYIPGWEVDIIRGEMFSDGYGFVVDYLAEILRNMRSRDYSQTYRDHFELSADISTRDRTAIEKTFSGLVKVLYPHGKPFRDEGEELLRFAVEGRKRIKDQLMRLDMTYASVRFAYRDRSGAETFVRTLEEETYPQYFAGGAGQGEALQPALPLAEAPGDRADAPLADLPQEKHLCFVENQRGVSFDALFGPYLKGATRLVITDPYIRVFFQVRNLTELLETLARQKADEDEVAVHLVTTRDELKGEQQDEYLAQVQRAAEPAGIRFTWEYDASATIHARDIVTDHGWKILLDRGLDVFQRYEMMSRPM
jgi:ATP-dependent Lon protease